MNEPAATKTHPDAVSDHTSTMAMIQIAFQQFGNVALCIDDEDVRRARETVHMADSVGFLVDATKYREALANGRLDRQKRLIALYEHTKAELKVIFPEGWPD